MDRKRKRERIRTKNRLIGPLLTCTGELRVLNARAWEGEKGLRPSARIFGSAADKRYRCIPCQ